LDPAYVGLRVCGYTYQYTGLSNVVEDYLGYGTGDGDELDEVQIVDDSPIEQCGYSDVDAWFVRAMGGCIVVEAGPVVMALGGNCNFNGSRVNRTVIITLKAEIYL